MDINLFLHHKSDVLRQSQSETLRHPPLKAVEVKKPWHIQVKPGQCIPWGYEKKAYNF